MLDMYKRKLEAQRYSKLKKTYCQVCNLALEKNKLALHHIVPFHKGGSFKDGYITLCLSCHASVHTINGKVKWGEINEEVNSVFLKIISEQSGS